MSNYTKTTDFEAKDSLPTGDSGKIIRGAEFETEFDAISTAIATKADTAGPTFTGTLTFDTISDGTIGVTAFVDEDDMVSNSATLVPTQQSVKAYVDAVTTELNAQDLDFQGDTGGALSIDLDSESLTVAGGTGIDTAGLGNTLTVNIDSTVATLTGTQTLTNKTLTAPVISGNLTTDGTIDGRDVAADGTKLDGIESGATADQTAEEIRTLVEAATDSNVFTDADHTKLDGIEANATADQTDAEIRAAVEAATDSNVFTDADHTKLDGIEAGADVTDTTNVTAAGALMDSELTDITAVKSLDQGVATTDSPTFAGLTTTADVSFGDNDKAIFGAGSDLQIYSDGENSILKEGGGGNLIVNADNLNIVNSADTEFKAKFNTNGSVQLYYDNAEKFATTSTGIDVTGVVEATGYLAVEGTSGNTGAGTDRWIGGDGTAGTWFYNVPTGSNHYFAVNNSNKLAINSTGIDVTGTVAADGLTVEGTTLLNNGTNSTHLTLTGTTNRGLTISTTNPAGQNDAGAIYDAQDTEGGGVGSHEFRVGGESKLLIAAGGDISFYEDTGTTAKLFWDASAEALGVGTTSIGTGAKLQVEGETRIYPASGTGVLRFGSGGAEKGKLAVDASSNMAFETGGSERMRIDSSGNVGIGTAPDAISSNATTLNIKGLVNTKGGAVVLESADESLRSYFYPTSTGTQIGTLTNHDFLLMTNSTERMRIDSSGNLLVGKTAIGSTTDGFEARASGYTALSDTSGAALNVNRNTTDGNIATFTKDGTTVGSVGSVGGIDMSIGTGDTGLRFYDTEKRIQPFDVNSGLNSDAVISLGAGNKRFKDLHLSGSVRCPDYRSEGVLFLTYDADDSLQIRKDNGSEAARLDSSGNLLVGKTSASVGTDGAQFLTGGYSGVSATSTTALFANRNTTDGDVVEIGKNGVKVGSIGVDNSDNLYITGNASHAGLMCGSTEILPYKGTTLNDGANDLGASSFRWKDLYLSGGVYLGGTGSANKLDDYEEGTWTPTLVGTTSGSATVTIITAQYTKIGNMVSVRGHIQADLSTHNIVGVVEIGGLPFTSNSQAGAGIAGYQSLTSATPVVLRPVSAQLRLGKGDSNNVLNSDLLTASNALIFFEATYQTAF